MNPDFSNLLAAKKRGALELKLNIYHVTYYKRNELNSVESFYVAEIMAQTRNYVFGLLFW